MLCCDIASALLNLFCMLWKFTKKKINTDNIYNFLLLSLLSDFPKAMIPTITVPRNVLSSWKLWELGILDFMALITPFLTLVLDFCEPSVPWIARLNGMKQMLLYIQTPHPWRRLILTPIIMLTPAGFRERCLCPLNKMSQYPTGGYCKHSIYPHPFLKLSFIGSQIYFLMLWMHFLYGSAVCGLLNYYIVVSGPITSCIGQVIYSLNFRLLNTKWD